MRTSFFKILTIALVLLVAGLGCKGLNQEEQQAIKPITIDYWTIFNDVDMLKAFAAEYKQIRPYVNVRIRQVRHSEFDDLFVNALADDVEPDIISVHNQAIGKYKKRLDDMPSAVTVANVQVKGRYAKEVIVTPEKNRMPSVNTIKANYVTAVAEDTIIDGNKYGLPLAIDTLAIYYNKDLLDQAGIPLPPESWEEFLDVVQETTKFSTSGNIVQSGVAMGTSKNIPRSFDILSTLMMQNGVTMTSNGKATFSDNFKGLGENHPSLQSLRFYTDFARPTKEVYSWNDKQKNALTEFVRGKSVFYFGFAYDRAEILRRAPQMNLEAIPVPQLNPARPVNVANYWVEAVTKKSKHQQVAWDFIRFMSSPNNIKRYTDATGQPTPLRAQIQEQKNNPALAAFASQALHATNWYAGSNIDVAKDAFATMIKEYNQPYGEGINPLERDVNIVINAAKRVQQTL